MRLSPARVLLSLAMLIVWGVDAAATPAVKLQPEFFQLIPGNEPTVYRLVVVPIRFPEDRIVGGGDLQARLNDEALDALRGYYLGATGDRLRIEVTLAPELEAWMPRTWYAEGSTFANCHGDPRFAYPNNARRLVEEAITRSVDAVDFRRFDNTGDGIVDGLLVLHSGPPALEGEVGQDCSVLLPHAFDLLEQQVYGDATFFPYALASTQDAIGVWAHETGHLFGFPDLYTRNGLCPGPGVGDVALMATGANLDEGQAPSTLSAYSRQELGFVSEPTRDHGVLGAPLITVPLDDETQYIRAATSDPDRYFLVERRTGANGLNAPEPGWLVYFVDAREGFNGSCTRALVELRAQVCPGFGDCTARLDDLSSPSLQYPEGLPSGVVLEFDPMGVRAYRDGLPALSVERVILDNNNRTLAVRVANTSISGGSVDLRAQWPDTSRVYFRTPDGSLTRTTTNRFTVPGNDVVFSDGLVLVLEPEAAGGTGDLVPLVLEVTSLWTLETVVDTVWVRFGAGGLARDLESYEVVTTRGESPWEFVADQWVATGPFDPFLDTSLLSPWFRVPLSTTSGPRPRAALLLDHAWAIEALAPDLALDGIRVELVRQNGPQEILAPGTGWGYTILRTGGSVLAGMDALSGHGDRLDALGSAVGGETVRLRLRLTSDYDGGEGSWTVRDATLGARSTNEFVLEQVAEDPRRVRVLAQSNGVPARITLWEGVPAVTATWPWVRPIGTAPPAGYSRSPCRGWDPRPGSTG